MSKDHPDLKEEIGIALNIIKKRWGLPTRLAVMARLLNEKDATLLQIAARRVKLGATKGTIQEDESE